MPDHRVLSHETFALHPKLRSSYPSNSKLAITMNLYSYPILQHIECSYHDDASHIKEFIGQKPVSHGPNAKWRNFTSICTYALANSPIIRLGMKSEDDVSFMSSSYAICVKDGYASCHIYWVLLLAIHGRHRKTTGYYLFMFLSLFNHFMSSRGTLSSFQNIIATQG